MARLFAILCSLAAVTAFSPAAMLRPAVSPMVSRGVLANPVMMAGRPDVAKAKRVAAQKRLDKFKKDTGSTKTRALAKKRLKKFKADTGSTKTRALAKKRLTQFKADTGSTKFKAQKKAAQQKKAAAKKAVAKKAPARKAPPKKASAKKASSSPATGTSEVSPAVVLAPILAIAAYFATLPPPN